MGFEPKAKIQCLEMLRQWQKTKAVNYHEIYMHSEYLKDTNDSKSLSDIFYIGKTLCPVYISTTTQAFNGLKSQRQGHMSRPRPRTIITASGTLSLYSLIHKRFSTTRGLFFIESIY